VVFTLFNSSDIFLLLKLKQSGLGDTDVIWAYIFYNLVYAALAFPIGILADKLGFKKNIYCRVGRIRHGIFWYGFYTSSGYLSGVIFWIWTLCSGHRRH
jgi:MFS family permease